MFFGFSDFATKFHCSHRRCSYWLRVAFRFEFPLLTSRASISSRIIVMISSIDFISSDVLQVTCNAISLGIQNMMTSVVEI